LKPVPSSAFGQNAPSNRITLGIIGCGNQSTVDIPEWLKCLRQDFPIRGSGKSRRKQRFDDSGKTLSTPVCFPSDCRQLCRSRTLGSRCHHRFCGPWQRALPKGMPLPGVATRQKAGHPSDLPIDVNTTITLTEDRMGGKRERGHYLLDCEPPLCHTQPKTRSRRPPWFHLAHCPIFRHPSSRHA
jgi:hypothetical protein